MISEGRLQQDIIMWFNNTHPEYRGLLCYNLNNSTGGRTAKMNKYLGVVAGRSDLVLYKGGVAYMIELKTLKGRQSTPQLAWESKVRAEGFDYNIVRSLEDFKDLISQIFF